MWAVGFPFDVTTDGRPIKIVSVVDEHTRECRGDLVARRINGRHLIDELDHLAGRRGTYPTVQWLTGLTVRSACPGHNSYVRYAATCTHRSTTLTIGAPIHGARSENPGREVAMNRIITSVGLAAGGAMAAVFLSMGVAAATPSNTGSEASPDPFGLTPTSNLDVTSQTGSPLENIAYGTQTFDFDSNNISPFVDAFLTKNVTVGGHPLSLDSGNPFIADDLQAEVIDKLSFGGQEQQILFPSIDNTNIDGGVIDIHNWGNDWGYIYIDLVGAGHIGPADDAVGTWLVTPVGTFDVSWWEDGSFYGSPYLESELFDLSGFNPGADFSDEALTPVASLF